jgi:cytoskeletal protein CcmA (bactofilin family)
VKQRNPARRRFSGFLDAGTSFRGDLNFEGTLRVDGEVVGSVSTPDVLIVGPSATIRANINAGAVQVHGRVVGDVACTHRLELCAEGRIEGDIRTPHLVVEEGARFDGGSRMTEPGRSDTSDLGELTLPVEVVAASECVAPDANPVTPIHAPDTEPEDEPDEEQTRSTGWRGFLRQLEAIGLRALPPTCSPTPDGE